MAIMKMPTYLKKFSCLADKCEDTCCTGFTIPIDKKTFTQYETLGEPYFSADAKSNVKKNSKSTSDLDYGYINATCSCPFLTENGMCGVQNLLGEQALSSNCSKYPKHISVIDKQAEKWATLSCPEIARLVLLDKEGMTFEEQEEPIDATRDMASFQLQTDALPMTKHFYELREFSIQTLQDRTHSLETRMGILDVFYKEMNVLVTKGKENEIQTLIEASKHQKQFILKEDEFNFDEFAYTLSSLREKSPFVSRYEQTVTEMFNGLDKDINTIGLEFLEANEHILENYLVHYVFQKLFPFSYGDNVYEAYKMLELHYDLLRVHILGVGSYLEEMDEKIVVRVIQSFVKEADHNSSYLPIFFNKLMKTKQ